MLNMSLKHIVFHADKNYTIMLLFFLTFVLCHLCFSTTIHPYALDYINPFLFIYSHNFLLFHVMS